MVLRQAAPSAPPQFDRPIPATQGDAGCGAGVGPTWSADAVRGGRGVARAGTPREGARGGAWWAQHERPTCRPPTCACTCLEIHQPADAPGKRPPHPFRLRPLPLPRTPVHSSILPPAACHSSIVPIDSVLLPCCSTFAGLMAGGAISDGYGSGANSSAAAAAPQVQAFLAHVGEVLKKV
jgi:hypothetical protein